jgi:hypothetical protein
MSVKFEIPYDFAECTLNFPLIDKTMFNTGLRFSEKIIQVQLIFILTISTTLKNPLMKNWKN